MNALGSNDELTPYKLIRKYPQMENNCWNAQKIGVFLNGGLLLGDPYKCLIPESSFIALIEFHNKVVMKFYLRDVNEKKVYDFYTAEELLGEYPKSHFNLHWNETKIGIYLNTGLLFGHKNVKEKRAVIAKESFEYLIHYANSVNRQRNVDL